MNSHVFTLPRFSHNNITIAHCTTCGYAHLTTLPTQAELDAYYGAQDSFYSGRDWLVKEDAEHKAGYWNAAYAYRLSLLTNPPTPTPNHGPIACTTTLPDPTPIIDVGCGLGYFAQYATYHGHFSVGIEPSPSARALSPHPYIYPSLDGIITKGHIHLSLVLEHILDPHAFLATITSHMNPGNRLLVMVPNEFNPLQRRLTPTHGHWYIAPPHINYFTPSTLTTLLSQHSLTLTHSSSTFPTELYSLLFRQSYIGNDAIGRRCHRARLTFERFFGPLSYSLYSLLHRRFSWGRELLYTFTYKPTPNHIPLTGSRFSTISNTSLPPSSITPKPIPPICPDPNTMGRRS